MSHDNLDLAISDSGPNHEIHVYQRASGKIVWRKHASGDATVHAVYMAEARNIVENGLKAEGWKSIAAIIEELECRLAFLEAEYEHQGELTKAPGNPYITGLGGRIAGVKEAIKLLQEARS